MTTARILRQGAAAWLVLAVGAILNGGFREAVLSPAFGEPVARASSITLLLLVILLVSGWMVARKWRDLPYGALLLIGASWALGSALFEFGLGRLVFDIPWSELLAAYDLPAGQYWILAPITMTIAPALVKRLLDRDTTSARGQGTS